MKNAEQELIEIDKNCETFKESKLEELRVYISKIENIVKSIKCKIRKPQGESR